MVKARSGAIWTALSRFGNQGLQFLSSLILARLLLPREYGLVAIAYVFVGFAGIFRDLGLGGAIIHRRDLTRTDEDTAFWISAVSGFLVTGVLIALSVPLADFFHEPALRGLIILASLTFTVSVSTVPAALLERQLRFRSLATLEVAAGGLGLAMTVVSALAGLGAASLLLGPLIGTVIQVPLTFYLARWRPGLQLSRAAARRLWSFGGFLAAFNIANYFSRNGDNLLVGKVLGSGPLGLYSRAYNLMLLPVTLVTQVLGRVLFPAYSQISDDIPRLRRAVVASLKFTSAITFLVAALFLGLGTDLIVVLYGDNWRGAGPALELLAVAVCPQIIGGTAGAVLQALGRTDVQFRLGMISAVLLVASAAFGLFFGILGVSAAFTIGAFISTAITIRAITGLLETDARTLLRPIVPALVAGAVCAVAEALVRATLTGHELTTVAIGMVVGVAVYLLVLALVDVAAFKGVVNLLRGRHSLAADS